jgi:hypothetical protein
LSFHIVNLTNISLLTLLLGSGLTWSILLLAFTPDVQRWQASRLISFNTGRRAINA